MNEELGECNCLSSCLSCVPCSSWLPTHRVSRQTSSKKIKRCEFYVLEIVFVVCSIGVVDFVHYNSARKIRIVYFTHLISIRIQRPIKDCNTSYGFDTTKCINPGFLRLPSF